MKVTLYHSKGKIEMTPEWEKMVIFTNREMQNKITRQFLSLDIFEYLKDNLGGRETKTHRYCWWKFTWSSLFLKVIWKIKTLCKEFPGGPEVKTPSSIGGDGGSIPSQGTKIPRAAQCNQMLKKQTNKNHAYGPIQQ